MDVFIPSGAAIGAGSFLTRDAEAALSDETTLATAFGADVFASRPAFGNVGFHYYATDQGIVYRDNGTAWEKVAVRVHANLDSIGANDHHAQSHVIDGADHSGTLAHTALDTVGANDHHAQSHVISGADHSGTLTHAALGSVTADQHHAQAHVISGADHTGTLTHAALGSVTADQHHREATLMTEVATTSGTVIDFTGIPSGVKRIEIMLAGISTNGTSPYLIQLGDSGGIEATGYTGAIATNLFSVGFRLIVTPAATTVFTGIVTLLLEDATQNTWSMTGIFADEAGAITVPISAGKKSLSAVLDRVRLTATNGTDTFDLGAMNVMYE